MKFGKEFASQMVQEWREAYMDYNSLKAELKDIMKFRQQNYVSVSPVAVTPTGGLKRRLSMYRAFSGLTSRYNSLKGSPRKSEDEVILVSAVQEEEGSDGYYRTMFLKPSEEGGELEQVFFRRLDDEFNKVIKFYKAKVQEVTAEAEELSKQMNALIALRIKVDRVPLAAPRNPLRNQDSSRLASVPDPPVRGRNQGMQHMDVIQEVEMSSDRIPGEVPSSTISGDQKKGEKGKAYIQQDFRPAPLEVLDHVKINVEPETPVSTLKNVLGSTKSDLSFSKEELRIAEEKISRAFIEFYQKLRLLKSYSFLNQLAFSKIMKKYDKITSRGASKSYMEMVDRSYLGTSEEVTRLIERLETTFIKHFSNGNRRKGMEMLRPKVKREKHRTTYFLGFLSGCSVALVAAVIVTIHARNLLKSEGRQQYMDNIFPLYSLFGFIVLHMVMYAGNIYYWRRYRVNYPFMFGFKQGTELGYREVLLVASGLSVLALAAVLSNLDMEMDPTTKTYQTLTELVPLGLLTVLIFLTFCPFNIIYRSSRFFLIKSVWHCLCAPLFKVVFADFFLADQLTSQVQAIRSLQFYVCYYGWGDFKARSNKCQDYNIYKIFYIVVAVLPYWARFLQCLRRLFEEKDFKQGLNGLKYLSTIVALVMRTGYELRRGRMSMKIIAASTSGIATIFNTYWDIVMDWGLLRKNSRNPWLRDKLLVPNKIIYFLAIVVNILLRLVWMQLIFDIQEAPFLHRRAMVAVVACLEILRRGLWNFFRLENEHLNNVGKYRAFKSVPLPFNYDEDKSI